MSNPQHILTSGDTPYKVVPIHFSTTTEIEWNDGETEE